MLRMARIIILRHFFTLFFTNNKQFQDQETFWFISESKDEKALLAFTKAKR